MSLAGLRGGGVRGGARVREVGILRVPPPRPEQRIRMSSSSTLTHRSFSRVVSPCASSGGGMSNVDRNYLQTLLSQAVAAEDYAEAARIRDALEAAGATRGEGWVGISDWLLDRLESMDYRLPTAIQSTACKVIMNGRDCCISSPTGSGKTLAIATPMLQLLQKSLFEVEEIQRQGASKLLNPLALLIVPSRELGAQLALLIYRMLGGNLGPSGPGSLANMFRYQGPKAVKVVGLLSEQDVQNASVNYLLEGVSIVVAMPDYAAEAIQNGSLDPVVLRYVGVDEIDLCMARHEDALQVILKHSDDDEGRMAARQTVFAGATMTETDILTAISKKWLKHPVLVTENTISGINTDGSVNVQAEDLLEKTGNIFPSLGDSGASPITISCPPNIRHFIGYTDPGRELLMLSRLLRIQKETMEEEGGRMRAIIFMDDEEEIRIVAKKLRDLLWRKHTLELLLPDTGVDPLRAAQDFRDGTASLLITTMTAARGLDFPAISHVYSLGPPEDRADYLHRAGRAGRIGTYINGVVTTIVSNETQLETMKSFGAALGITMEVETMSDFIEADGDGDGEMDDNTRLKFEELFLLVDATPETDSLERSLTLEGTEEDGTTQDKESLEKLFKLDVKDEDKDKDKKKD